MPDASLSLRIRRSPRRDETRDRFELVEVAVDRDRETVLDALERAWAQVDRTIVFRHACHHGSCGTCAIRVDGRERLSCLAFLRDVWDGRSTLTLEPLRNVALYADLAIDPSLELARMAVVRLPYVRAAEPRPGEDTAAGSDGDVAERFEDCIECLACVSACPVAGADPAYLGPAVLSAAARVAEEPRGADPRHVLELVDSDHGVWQCRSVWACSAVCPSGVDPAARIMDLRRRVLTRRRGPGRELVTGAVVSDHVPNDPVAAP